MNREQLRSIVARAMGDPASGSSIGLIDEITDALDQAINPARETRVIAPTETR